MPVPSTREDAVALARNVLDTEARAILGTKGADNVAF